EREERIESGAGAQRGQAAIRGAQDVGKRRKRAIEVGTLKESGIVQHRTDEVVDDARIENVRVIQLAFILGLVALDIKERADGIGVRGLVAAVELYAAEQLVVVAELVVNAAAEQPLAVPIRNRHTILSEASAGEYGVQTAAGVAGHRLRIGDAGSVVIERKE